MRWRRLIRLAYPLIPDLRVLELAEDLRRIGWVESHRTLRPVTATGEPVPWWTYAAINHLEGLLSMTMRVFEWGSGASTLWLASRVSEVVTVEHDERWVIPTPPSNVEILLRSAEDYAAAIRGRGPFDLVVIDGIDRDACAAAATAELSSSGLVVWDDSERPYDFSPLANLRRTDFCGLRPINARVSCTSVFACP